MQVRLHGLQIKFIYQSQGHQTKVTGARIICSLKQLNCASDSDFT